MKRLIVIALMTASSLVLAQNRGEALDNAYEQTRAAYLAWQAAEERRAQGVEAQPGERSGTAAGGGSRPNEQYFQRQAQLEREAELARKRYEAAARRWNDLK